VNVPDLAARARRLEQLVIGLMRESQKIAAGDDPLLYPERRAYLLALQAACSGLENARVVLAKARQRAGGASGDSPTYPRNWSTLTSPASGNCSASWRGRR
jgi:hypothetical protein